MTVLSDALQHPDCRKVFLLELTAGCSLFHWTGSGPWTAPVTGRVVGLVVDGEDVTELAGWSWDGTSETLTVSGTLLVGGVALTDPYAHVWEARVQFCFSNVAKRFGGVPYLPLVDPAPSLEQSIPAVFGGVGVIGGGSVTFDNREGLFDDLMSLNWDGGGATLLLGVDLPLPGGTFSEMAYADYETQGVWYVASWEATRTKATLEFKELSAKLKTDIPTQVFDRETYPAIAETVIGKTIPIGYGSLYRVPCYCIDVAGKRFKAFGHAVHSFANCRSGGSLVDLATYDLSLAEFTLSDWTEDTEVVIDCIARVDGSGNPMVSPADVIQDLLETWGGVTNLDATAFATARAAWVYGTDAAGVDVHEYEIARYFGEAEDLLDSCAEIAAACHAILRTDALGRFALAAWRPVPSEGATQLAAHDVKEVSGLKAETADVVTQLTVRYAKQQGDEGSEVVQLADDDLRYRRALTCHVSAEVEAPFSLLRCADLHGSRRLAMEGVPRRCLEADVSHRAYGLVPGDSLLLDAGRLAGGWWEVLAAKVNLDSRRLELTLSNWRGFEDRPGFWMDDAPTFPSRLGGGSCAAWDAGWSEEQKAWARQNVGYWTDDNGFADASDPDSYLASVWV